jgi:RNA polymerase sigma factor (sigma-70 family)
MDIEQIAQRMIHSNEQAYREFARYFGPRFRSYFMKSGLSESESEDLAVSCISDVGIKIHQYKQKTNGSFQAWVYTFARNALADWYRKREMTVQLHENIAISDDDKSNSKYWISILVIVEDLMRTFNEIDRCIIQLRYFGGEYSFREIARRVKLKETNVRVRHHRILQKLREQLEPIPQIQAVLTQRKPVEVHDEQAV